MGERIGLCQSRKHFENGEIAFFMAKRRTPPVGLTESQRMDWLLGWDSANQRRKDPADE